MRNIQLCNRTGITWLDDVRVPYESEKDKSDYKWAESKDQSDYGHKFMAGVKQSQNDILPDNRGRFPANLCVSDNVLDDGQILKSGSGDKRCKLDQEYFNGFSSGRNNLEFEGVGGDSGAFSRYFSLDSWWQSKIKQLPLNIRKTFPFMIVPKASRSEKESDIKYHRGERAFETYDNTDHLEGNKHPTVKPISLLSYLITLGSRENDLILDPFIGSGTTAISARLLTRNFIGFEREPEYHKIAEARIKKYMEQNKLSKWQNTINTKSQE